MGSNDSISVGGKQNGLSLKEIIISINGWSKYILSKWLVYIIVGIIGAGIGLLLASIQKDKYEANLTFVIENSQSGDLSSYAGLASQFGIDLGGTVRSGIFSGDNILEFLKSRMLIEKTLLLPIEKNGKGYSMADYYLNISDLKKESNSAISFPLEIPRAKLDRMQDSVLNIIYTKITESNLKISKLDKKLDFIQVRFTSKDELFSKIFTENLVKEAIDFYINTKIQRYNTNIDRLQMKADSIEKLLNQSTVELARIQDINLNAVRRVAGVSNELAQRNKTILQTMYIEVVKNLELTKISLVQERPIIQIIDKPLMPLKNVKIGKVRATFIGAFVSMVLAFMMVVVMKLYKNIMAE
ncbi:lipopolysaccharide biosynthesis protein [Chitinophaga caeni]|uniref:Lipopolysaccharide biosynthesis protein n=1 Tax=Chitinophaga caeni TaxID=2029983 RepID=A0A291QQT5_9BACT|nr:lipopolysaccharide biosynthesis protein [Chitinophaga caeni]ATL46253.1 lipopolysaccharide biosynthesis protein [Chitinophaga caeni]